MKVILGIHEAHDASTALMVDGKIVAAAQKERFTGLKCDYGYPEQAINFCLSHHISIYMFKTKEAPIPAMPIGSLPPHAGIN